MAKQCPPGGEGLNHSKPQSSGRGVITLRKERCCLRSSTIGGRGPFSPPGYVRRSEDWLSEPRSPRLDHQRCWMTHKFSGPGAVTEANSPAAYSPFPRLRGR